MRQGISLPHYVYPNIVNENMKKTMLVIIFRKLPFKLHIDIFKAETSDNNTTFFATGLFLCYDVKDYKYYD